MWWSLIKLKGFITFSSHLLDVGQVALCSKRHCREEEDSRYIQFQQLDYFSAKQRLPRCFLFQKDLSLLCTLFLYKTEFSPSDYVRTSFTQIKWVTEDMQSGCVQSLTTYYRPCRCFVWEVTSSGVASCFSENTRYQLTIPNALPNDSLARGEDALTCGWRDGWIDFRIYGWNENKPPTFCICSSIFLSRFFSSLGLGISSPPTCSRSKWGINASHSYYLSPSIPACSPSLPLHSGHSLPANRMCSP